MLPAEYKDVVVRLFPALPGRVLDSWSIFPVDALALGYFLEHYPRKVVALDIGASGGVSTFCFASHPNVSRVICVDPNPTILDELISKSDTWSSSVELGSLKDLRMLDVARAALAEFGDEKVQLREGAVAGTRVGIEEGYPDGLKEVDVSLVDPSEEAGLVALMKGPHTKEGVQAHLTAIFDRNPHAVVLLNDCRHTWGPLAQAGVIGFKERAPGAYHFRLIGDLGPGLATSNLGVIYPDSVAAETTKALNEVNSMFSQRLDPLRLLRREEELIGIVNEKNQKLQKANKARAQLEEQNSGLKKRNADLIAHYASRRYKLADAFVSSMLRIPGVRNLLPNR